ncbi:spermidine/putrescine ABC transporter [Paracoccus versutus]|nr:spermidine/putrescine ABC transporter [Paracoccus versutus]
MGITRKFGSFTALDDVSIDVRRGEFLTLLGPSGSGKSTLLNILAGFDAPTEGRLVQDGHDVTRKPAEARNFGMVFQGYALFPHMSVARNVAFPLRVRKVPESEQKRRVAEVLERVGLSAHADKLPRQLSGGQQQRVALARALVFSPDVLLLDEPLSALDKNLREQLQLEFQRIHREFKTTFIFVTHDQTEALALSSRIAIFNRGRLMQMDGPTDIYTRPSSRFVAEFLGQINLFRVENVTSAKDGISGRFGECLLAAPGHVRDPAWVGVRPENMRLKATQPDASQNAVPVTVNAVSYHGPTVLLSLTAATDGTTNVLSATMPASEWTDFDAQKPHWLCWSRDDSLVFPQENEAEQGA